MGTPILISGLQGSEIPLPALPFGPFDGGMAESTAKGLWTDFQPSVQVGMLKDGDGIKSWFLMRLGEAIPGADVLTYIATKYPAFHLGFSLLRKKGIFQFDGQIG